MVEMGVGNQMYVDGARVGRERERTRIIARLVEMAVIVGDDSVAGTAETLRRAAAVIEIEAASPRKEQDR